MKKHITPFFQSVKVRYLNQITPLHILDLKDKLLKSGLTPQTINYNLHSFKKCLELLKVMGKITLNFAECDFSVKGSSEAETERDIFDIPALQGIFKKRWSNDFSKLLCMVIYFTGMRNSEIQRICFNDIQKINDVFFLNVRGTKSKNAVRKVPIHPVLYSVLEKHTKENSIDNETPIFQNVYNNVFRRACFDMGSMLGYTETDLVEKHICYYSGRHTFKTILSLGNDESIGNVSVNFQEMFLGHSFNRKQLEKEGLKEYKYKHLKAERIGDSLLAEKGKEVFKILTRYYL
jgi:integrase